MWVEGSAATIGLWNFRERIHETGAIVNQASLGIRGGIDTISTQFEQFERRYKGLNHAL